VGIALAAVYAFALSLQFLAQPFVWRNFPVEEIAVAWSFVFRDRLIVAAAIALTILCFSSLRRESLGLRAVSLAAGIVIGAVIGELIVRRLGGRADLFDSLAPHAMRWSVIAFAIAATFYLWRYSADSSERLRAETLRRASIEQQLTNTRLSALKSQIEPHFLFNTLATLRRLHHVEPEAGARMLANFIDYLRRILPMLDRSEVSLGEELELARAYLSVIQARMAGRLSVIIDVPGDLRSILLPPLALATLVENAVIHGITPSPAGGEISIRAREHAGQAVLTVADTGIGLKLDGDCGSGPGIGLSNVRARLMTLYGATASLRVEVNEPSGVQATIHLPGHRKS